jgi:two-component system copper resistance phosphate regulon response regulator CusR
MRVLIVEDDHELATAVCAELRSVGFAVDLATSGCEAAYKVGINRYDCLVVDRGLPDGDGLRLVRRLREDGSPIPVLILTARDAIADRLAGFAEGADDYLVKPFASAELVARIGALCRRAEQPRPVLIHVDDLELDLARRRVRRGEALLSLTAKEFAVLELLASRAGQVVTRSCLIECCWDEMAEPMSNVVDAAIAQIRRKLGGPPLITTVRGIGFVLAAPPPDDPPGGPPTATVDDPPGGPSTAPFSAPQPRTSRDCRRARTVAAPRRPAHR